MPQTLSNPFNRDRIEEVLRCVSTCPRPPFMPAIYEHKAWFIGETPSSISRSEDLFFRAIMAEYEAIGPDSLVVGVDVYNLEAEAAGCQCTFYEGDDTSIPGIKPGNHVVSLNTDLEALRVPNPLRDGRMPINVRVAERVVREVGRQVWVRGAISGPFSLAISLMGSEDLFVACIDDPDFVARLLGYCEKVIRDFAKAYIDAGAELIIFDSQASPELLSPAMYEEFVLPVMQRLTGFFERNGVRDVPLIIGGNTTPIADLLMETGCNNLLCDFTGDWDEWSDKCRAAGRALRRNMAPRFIETSTPEEIYKRAAEMIAEGIDLPGFILGTAVIPFGTPTENVLAVRQACENAAR